MKWTVGQIIQWSTEYLVKKGIDTPRLDSEVLLAHVLNIDRTNLFLDPQRSLSSHQLQSFKKLIGRRSLREPLSYITGFKEFWSLNFKVNRHVLIPRPETEILVQKTLEILKEHCSNHTGLFYVNDIGTGSGNIAVSLCKKRGNLRVVATDHTGEALSMASENTRLNNCEKQICFQKTDLFGEFKRTSDKNKFDLIVSNPPYIPSDEIETLAPEIKDYEPRIALEGGPDGLNFYKKIITEVPNHLIKGGFIILEMGYNQGKAISKIFSEQGFFSEIEISKDYSGKDRVISARFL